MGARGGLAAPLSRVRSNAYSADPSGPGCLRVFGCYPFGIGILSGMVAKKRKEQMVEALLDGKTSGQNWATDRE